MAKFNLYVVLVSSVLIPFIITISNAIPIHDDDAKSIIRGESGSLMDKRHEYLVTKAAEPDNLSSSPNNVINNTEANRRFVAAPLTEAVAAPIAATTKIAPLVATAATAPIIASAATIPLTAGFQPLGLSYLGHGAFTPPYIKRGSSDSIINLKKRLIGGGTPIGGLYGGVLYGTSGSYGNGYDSKFFGGIPYVGSHDGYKGYGTSTGYGIGGLY
ncbi:5797_t:CDS:2 [Entrophospora sp. SA101]|nr:2703_t:CDS:2 [Entrophospora sp. SA101]CAJ0639347.1 13088_t:CDS:2 [Entrophospora sp. SA101]CAJ0764545.1 21353_t:CDS:2 [Entrophospora sp. SA101]CAJ0765312.1 5797_t:CDS:2 [Entrophospora sp. SA101]CAJ0833682.1 18880_t:CDS:2 [Entrophospora sp. SA101]